MAVAGTAGRCPGLLLLISPALMRPGGRRLLQKNVDLSVPENQNPVQGAWLGGWRRKPHLTWADTGIWNEAWPSGPGEVAPGPGPAVLPSHVCRCWLPPDQTGVGGERQRRSLPGEESWGLSPLCTPTCARRRLLQRRGLGLWQGFSGLVLGYSKSLEPLSSDPWLEALPKLLSPPTDLSNTSY